MTVDRASGALRLVSDRSGSAPSTSMRESGLRGELRLGFATRAGRTYLAQSYQAGCLRARSPRAAAGEMASVVLINTGGGVAGGDRLHQHISWGAGAHGVVAAQAAEKVYRSLGPSSVIDTRLELAGRARAEWLPQETILFDRARLVRRTEVRMTGDASFHGVEAVVLGRAAMGETVREGLLADSWRIWRDGRLIYADAQRLEGPIDPLMMRASIGAGARAVAVLIHVSAQAGRYLTALREVFANAAGRAAASAWNGMLVARFLAPDGQRLRADLTAALAVLRDGRAAPRVWTC
ncbi:urease accessory protein UreD [Phenylobacterium sp.]|uniref:urease accessory protein UreD n=1 Tax=Phenylobacterium sp. TaxID=1871053 RepID=UPI0027338C63|nr:urease accessory protein UreD [Phenylobacterium sp.]MDP3658638.1 urease accessory protein UreD [Phenylobacterium sp.]